VKPRVDALLLAIHIQPSHLPTILLLSTTVSPPYHFPRAQRAIRRELHSINKSTAQQIIACDCTQNVQRTFATALLPTPLYITYRPTRLTPHKDVSIPSREISRDLYGVWETSHATPPSVLGPIELTFRNYVQLEKLGEGTYATVYKVSRPASLLRGSLALSCWRATVKLYWPPRTMGSNSINLDRS
jgi:hypothetical protein